MDKFSSQVKLSADSMIKNVLNVTATDSVASCECAGGFVSVSGKVKVNVIYVSDTNEICHTELVSDFIQKGQSANLEKTEAVASAAVTNYTVSGNDIICFLEHTISVSGNFKYELPVFDSEKDSLVLKTKTTAIPKLVESVADDFVVAEEFESNISMASVLGTSANARVNEVTCLVDKIAVSGKVFAEIISKDESGVTMLTREFEFKQEIEASGTLPNMVANANVVAQNITVTPEETDGKTNFVCAVDVHAFASVYDENETEFVTDMFSLKNEIQTTYTYLELAPYAGDKTYDDTILMVSDVSTLEDFDDVIGVFEPKFTCESAEKVNGKYVISGEVSVLTIYKSTDGVGSYVSSKEAKVETDPCENLNLEDVKSNVQVTSFKVKAGKDLEVMLSLNLNAKFETELAEKYVKGYEIKSEKQDNFSGIKVYVTSGGETLFDAARNLNVRPELISSQNEISGNFESGEKIYVYAPLNLA